MCFVDFLFFVKQQRKKNWKKSKYSKDNRNQQHPNLPEKSETLWLF